jgi:regulation of enolase protein 1 (concanavalin A-like superfamily)
MVKKVTTIFLIITIIMTLFVQPAYADFQPELPSLYQVFNDYFMFGSFHSMSSFFGSNRDMMHHHYNIWAPSNEFKPSGLLDLNSAASSYNSVYNEVNADGVIDEAEEERLFEANTTIVLGSTSSQLNFLNQIRALNETRGPEDQVKVKAHTLFWHNLSQQPEAFFREGFSNSRPWATKEVMLARIDSYIQKVFERFAPYKDIIYSWDVVNEAIDDFTGFLRNENDYQESRWGRIFKRPDITDREQRLLEETVWIRQAFDSAAKYNNEYDLGLTLVYNDFFDANKDYEPKLTSTIIMLQPIYEQMKRDGVTFVVGLQNRNATSLDMNVFKDMYNRFAEVCDEIQTTESDCRSDYVANPNYSRDALPYYLEDGITKNPDWTWSAWQNTPNAQVALVRSGWTASMANQPEIQREQADWLADHFDFLLENSKANGGKLVMYMLDGVNDSNTFNSNKGCHIFMSADSSGNTNYTAKMSYYAVIGSVPRFEIRKLLEKAPVDDLKDNYTAASWNKFVQARQAAEDILDVRIYDLDGYNNAKNAQEALTKAVNDLVDVEASLTEIKVNGVPLPDFSPEKLEYNCAVPAGSLPEVAVTAADENSSVTITQATELPGQAVITVSSSDGSRQTVYTINFSVDTSLSSLKVDGAPVSGFSPDNLIYDIKVPYGSTPQVAAEPNDPGASVNITQAESVPGQAIIEVLAGGAKTTYTINFNVDSSLQSLKVNGIQVSGFSPDTYTYNVYIPEGIPVVTAVANDPNAPVEIIQADAVPGQARVLIGYEGYQLTYTVNFGNIMNGNDEFNEPTLNTALWHWVNEDPETWSLTKYPGYMTISPRTGDIYEGSTDAKNILLQDAPGDWTIETKLECSIRPYATYQQGGIIVYQDMDNYIKFEWEANRSNSTIIQVCREVNGSPTASSINGNVVGEDNTLWLRIVKNGNQYSCYYSVDGINFTQVGSTYTLNFNNVQAGLISINGSGTNTDLDVKFDYFHSTAVSYLPLPADKTDLSALINEVQGLDESEYTAESWANLQAVLADAIAIEADPAALQADVDQAVSDLQAAINALVSIGGPAAVITGIDSVQPGSEFEVEISLNTVTQSVYAEDITLSYDPAVFEYVSAASADEDIKVLRIDDSAAGTVRIIAANIGGLTGNSPVLNVGFKVKSGVANTSGTISIVEAKLGIMPEETIIQPILGSITISVGGAETVDKSALQAAINEAEELYNDAVVGIEDGNYWQADKEAFRAAIDAAIAVLNDINASQSQVDSAKDALIAAMEAFQATVITPTTGDLNNSSTIDIGDLALVAYYYGANPESENWAIASMADINKDNEVDIVDLAFIANRIPD